MRSKNKIKRCLNGLIVAGMVFGGSASASTDAVIHPISNPVYNDTAQTKTQVTAIYAFHNFPSTISTTAGKLPLDGYIQVLAVQLEYALSETLSIVANKDGIIFFNPDDTFKTHEGLADISAGLKWKFLSKNDFDFALRGTFEIPLGKEEVFQGNGDGNFSPALIATGQHDKWQCNNVIGAIFPFDVGDESIMGYLSCGLAYKLTEKLSPIFEVNWFHVYKEGRGSSDFSGQLGKTVPGIAKFDGPDLFNIGSKNGEDHPDYVSTSIGARYQLNDHANLGVSWEFPLTKEENNLFDHRINVNLAWKF